MLRYRAAASFFIILLLALLSSAQSPVPQGPTSLPGHPAVGSRVPAAKPTATLDECAPCVRRNLSYLAGPALQGRGSGTEDEHRAAQYIAAKLKLYGLAPAADHGSYIQEANIQSRTVTAPPTLSFDVNEAAKPRAINWEHGKEIAVYRLSQPEISGPLQKLDLNEKESTPASVRDGAVLLLKMNAGSTLSDTRAAVRPYLGSKAAMVIVLAGSGSEDMFGKDAKPPRLPKWLGEEEKSDFPTVVFAKGEAFDQLWTMSEGTVVKLHAETSPWTTAHTWNVLAKLEGTTAKDQIILLSAHLDHLGLQNGKVYPGADDDASGTVAVMELARALAKKPKLQRTIIFALWGSEELGMLGSQYFLKHPTIELKNLVANLEFEMIGRRDPKLKLDQLWLTGWARTDLGPQLASHGAKLVADPHPEQNFFNRSDNYALAKQGLIAQTVSSYGLHSDYHEPTDTVDKVDWQHLNRSIASMISPIVWLADSDFTPKWNEGQKP